VKELGLRTLACPSTTVRVRSKIALVLDADISPGRNTLKGIVRYAREHGPWMFSFFGNRASTATSLENWQGDGIIARVQRRDMVDVLRSRQCPVIDVLGTLTDTGFPVVHVDDAAIGKLGAEHLLERGFRNFGYYHAPNANWSDTRLAAFKQRLGYHDCQVLELGHLIDDTRSADPEVVQRDLQQVEDWLKGLKRPIAIFSNDSLARQVLSACQRVGFDVPDEVAVLGADNDELICSLTEPPLSSVESNHAGVGFAAAELLDRLLAGQPLPTQPSYVAPVGVVARPSTDVLAIDDDSVIEAVRFIREQACNGIDVNDVVKKVPLSRTLLQRRFRKALKCSIHDEIVRVRVRRAQELLAHTDLSIADVADKSGLTSQEYLSTVFKQRVGLSPAQFRRQARSGTKLDVD
jgi:LacI family transcriptional regulator